MAPTPKKAPKTAVIKTRKGREHDHEFQTANSMPRTRFKKREIWNEMELDYLKQWHGRMPLKELARQLARSERSIQNMAWVIGIGGGTHKENFFTRTTLALAVGVHHEVVNRWLESGYIRTTTLYHGNMPILACTRKSFCEFLSKTELWWFTGMSEDGMIDGITDPEFKRIAQLHQKSWGDKWIGIGRVSELFCLNEDTSRRIALSELETIRRRGKWWIFLESEVKKKAVEVLRRYR